MRILLKRTPTSEAVLLLSISLCCCVSCVREQGEVPQPTEAEDWQRKWENGSPQERKEALIWCHHNYVENGMSKKEVEDWLGSGIEIAFRSHDAVKCWYYPEWSSGIALFVFYERDDDDFRVSTTRLIEADTAEGDLHIPGTPSK